MKATALVLRQHRKIEQRIEALRTDGHRRSRCLADLVDDMTSHFAVESSLLYPAAQLALGLKLREERELHLRTKERLLALAAAPPSGPAFAERVRELREAFHQHVARVEGELLPALTQALGEAELQDLGEDMEGFCLALAAKGKPDLTATRAALHH
jgi:hypothetical protein